MTKKEIYQMISGVTPIKAEGHLAVPEFFQYGNAVPEI